MCAPPPGAHLVLETQTLAPSSRWRPGVLDWGVFWIVEGTAILHGLREKRFLETGDVVALPAGSVAGFSAARNRTSSIQFYLVSLELLTGVFSYDERRRMLAIADLKQPLVRHLGADPAACGYVSVFDGERESSPSLMRCEMLRLLALLLADRTADVNLVRRSETARERVAEFLKCRAESALVSHTVGELARFCGCSQRHFSRLFHECSGVCIRERQIQLRLKRAEQLLRESNAKIIQVAMDSGYRHIGLFNATFKKRFGMTPGEWRRRKTGARRVD